MSNPLGAYKLPEDKGPKSFTVQPQETKTQLSIEQEMASSLEQNVQFFWRSVLRGKYVILVVSLAISLLVFVYCKTQTPMYQAELKLLIEAPTGEAEEIVGFSQRRWWDETDMMTEKDVILSRVVAEKVVQNLKLTDIAPFKSVRDPIGMVLQRLKVEASPKSRVFKVRSLFEDPVLAAEIVNEVFNSYVQASEEKARSWIVRTVDQMRNEVVRLKRQLNADQQKLKQYEAEHPQIATREALEEQIKHLRGELATISSARLNLRTELEELAAFRKQGADVRDHPKIAKDPSIEQTLVVIQQKEVELTQLLEIYKGKFPLVVEKKAELGTLRAILGQRKTQILEDMKSKYIQLAARENELRKAAGARSDEHSALLAQIGGYEALLGEVEVSKNLYSLVLERMDKASIIGRAEQSKVKMLSRAEVPHSPFSPQTDRNVSMAFAISLAGMAYLVYLFFLMLKPIESEEEVSQGLKVPVLTELPYLKMDKNGETGLLVDQTEGFGKDALHFLRTALATTNQRLFVFTSANQSDGKTFAVYNLGVFLAREGRRVLLMGTDFRDLHLMACLGIKVEQAKSLERYLAGECDAQNILHPTKESGLFYVGSEKVVKNTLGAIASPKFQSLMQQLASQFDYVLFDSPPIKLFPDGKVLAQIVKNVIFVVRHAKTPYGDLSKGVDQLRKDGTHMTGVIINGKTLGWRNYYYYNYYYGRSGHKNVFNRLVHGAKGYATRLVESLGEKQYQPFGVSLAVECVYKLPDGKEHRFSAQATHGNPGGILMLSEYSDGKIDPHDFKELDLKITLREGTPVLARGTVTRVVIHRAEVRFNIKFLQISDEDRKRLLSLQI